MSKRKLKSLQASKKLWSIAIVVVIIVVVGLFLAWFTKNQTLYAPSKTNIETGLTNTLNNVDFSSKQIYNKLIDKGCDDSNSVGLQLYIHCDLIGHKYYRGSDKLAKDLKKADIELISHGWQRSFFVNQSVEDFENVLNTTSNNQIRYTRDGVSGSLYLDFYSKNSVGGYNIKQLIRTGELQAPATDEYIYGIRVEAPYWSCRNESFFKEPCPYPPSEPK